MITPKPSGRTMITLGVSVTPELKARIPRLPNGLQDQEWLRAAIWDKVSTWSPSAKAVDGDIPKFLMDGKGSIDYIRADLVDKLKGYAVHDDGCPMGPDCTCGLTETLRKLGE